MKRKSPEKEKKKKRGERKTSMILRVSQTAKDARGIAVENRVLEVAQYFRKKKVIKDVKTYKRFSPEDIEGKDLVITHLVGKELPIDVKTNYWFLRAAKKCQNLGTNLFPAGPEEDEEQIRARMLGLIISDLMSKLGMEEKREVISFINKKIEERAKIKPQPPLIKRILKKFFRGDK